MESSGEGDRQLDVKLAQKSLIVIKVHGCDSLFLHLQHPPCLPVLALPGGGPPEVLAAPGCGAFGPGRLFMFFIWKTTLKAVWNTLFNPFFSLAEQTTKPWKAYFLAACSISAFVTHSRSFASSPERSSSSRRSIFVPTKMQGHARAVVLTSEIHF